MAEISTQRIRAGAPVRCGAERVGRIVGLEPAANAAPEQLLVRRASDDRDVLVRASLVREVADDGTVTLACERADLERLRPYEREVSTGLQDRGPVASHEETGGTLQLEEEQLVPRKEMREVGFAEIRKDVETVPRRLEVEAERDEAIIEHVPVNQVVSERTDPWEENGVLVVPVYEEQLVVVKRLVLKEHVRIRRQRVTERQVFEDTVRRERLVVDDPSDGRLVRERHRPDVGTKDAADEHPEGDRTGQGVLERLGRKLLE